MANTLTNNSILNTTLSATTYSSPTYTITTGTSLPGSYTLMSNGTSSGWSNLSINNDLKGDQLQVKGNANFEGDVKIKGKSIADSLERIEERLAILRPNEELEEKWEKLRGLRKAYMELEAEIKEKELIWATLKR